jgi:pimeloyl-ACP methyl ester carboxylesterase
MTEPRREDVAVAGGRLATFRLGSAAGDAPLALAVHGITSNSQAWRAVARAAGEAVTLAAVDLRGRGASHQLPPPFGIAAHVRDLVAVLDQLELERAVVMGHSLGAYIAASLAVAHPERVAALVLVDGGLTIPSSEGSDPEQFLEAFLGPTLARLRMSFPDRTAYRAWWAEHPAIAAGDVETADLEHYADHDLVGAPPDLRSSVNPEVVRVDGTDLFRVPDASAITGPATLLCAARGMVDDPNPMQPLEIGRAWAAADPGHRRVVPVADVNHYTITLGRRGAAAVAAELCRAVEDAADRG